MTSSRILVTDAKARAGAVPSSERAWLGLGGIGVAFAVVAAADLGLTWVPLQFGNVEWIFGTVTATLSNLPLLSMGLALAVGSAIVRGSLVQLRVLSAVLVVLAVLLVVAGGLYVQSIGAAREAVTDPVIRGGLRNAIIRTSVQAVAYPLAYAWLGLFGWRYARQQ